MLFQKSNPTLGWLATPRRNRATVVPPTVPGFVDNMRAVGVEDSLVHVEELDLSVQKYHYNFPTFRRTWPDEPVPVPLPRPRVLKLTRVGCLWLPLATHVHSLVSLEVHHDGSGERTTAPICKLLQENPLLEKVTLHFTPNGPPRADRRRRPRLVNGLHLPTLETLRLRAAPEIVDRVLSALVGTLHGLTELSVEPLPTLFPILARALLQARGLQSLCIAGGAQHANAVAEILGAPPAELYARYGCTDLVPARHAVTCPALASLDRTRDYLGETHGMSDRQPSGLIDFETQVY
ncbi:hypothetical protein BV25DRAFT_1921240 [Artomyces pyxidatus]|uniref:Uncharacterized protein n=1 Tax=Artomyces pyxidatus TaxID=48021 RepID=A0ACB8SIM6_9AGAM|nr:hypothetical protein BV25DRAFT_1921240 [Artomyces pyxidatus]